MKEAYWGYWIMVLGVFVVIIMLLIQNVTSNNTENTYTVDQISEASMIDAIDYAYYRQYGELKINREKFVESFMRRFADNASLTTDYTLVFAGIYETPPKVGVEITSKTEKYVIAYDETSFDLASRVEAILEQTNTGSSAPTVSGGTTNSGSSSSSGGSSSSSGSSSTPNPETTRKNICSSRGASNYWDLLENKQTFINDLTGEKVYEEYLKDKGNVECTDAEKQNVIAEFKQKVKEARVPDISSLMVARWAQQKFYNAKGNELYEFKQEYACNPDKFASELLAEWKNRVGTTLTTEEQNELVNKAKSHASKICKS